MADDNDRLRGGTLPNSPFADTAQVHSAAEPDRPEAQRQAGFAPNERAHAESIIGARWRSAREQFGDDWLLSEPPPRQFLVTWEEPVDNRSETHGLIPAGRVGMFVGAGGVGKSWALMQLAISVATGRRWLDRYEVKMPGHVLLAFGEEESPEIHRRLYHAARALDLSTSEIRALMAEERILPLSLDGLPVPLIEPFNRDTGEARATAFAEALRARILSSPVEWRLIIFDPLSRFGGPDSETEAAAATRLVQEFERLAKEAPGQPAVLVAHHTTKASRTTRSTDATAARGSSALIDGIRWAANLESPKRTVGSGKLREEEELPDFVRLRVVKGNYSKRPPPLLLARSALHGGALRAATARDTERYNASREEFEDEPGKRAAKNGEPRRSKIDGGDYA